MVPNSLSIQQALPDGSRRAFEALSSYSAANGSRQYNAARSSSISRRFQSQTIGRPVYTPGVMVCHSHPSGGAAPVAVPAHPVASSCMHLIGSRRFVVSTVVAPHPVMPSHPVPTSIRRAVSGQSQAPPVRTRKASTDGEISEGTLTPLGQSTDCSMTPLGQSAGSFTSWSPLPLSLEPSEPLLSVPRTILTANGLHRALSSVALQHEFERLCPGGDPSNAHVVFDITAFVYDGIGSCGGSSGSRGPSDLEERRKSAELSAKLFADDYGIQHMDVFDLSAPDFDEGLYADAVKSADVYYADVGNTWALLHWLKARGAMTQADGVMERTKRGEMLYVGNSAGGICGGRSVETATWKNWDDMWEWQKLLPADARTDWTDPSCRTAMDLAGGVSFFPHYDSSWAKVCEERRMELDHDVVLCANGDGLVVINGSSRLASADCNGSHGPFKF